MFIGTVADAIEGHRRRHFEGPGNFRGYTDFMFETPPGEPPGPQAFLVHQAPDWSLPAHFHMQHQFQVIAGGGGRLGVHEVTPGSVHYASPQSGYGPLVAGADGVEYFTLRVRADRGAWYMPESRQHMDRGMRKEQVTQAPSPDEALADKETLIAVRDDGLGAWRYRVDAGQSLACDEPVGKAGRFHVVLRGSFRLGDTELARHSCVYWSPPDASPVFEAGEASSEMVIVQFPEAALYHEVPEEVLAAAPRQAVAPAAKPA